MLSVMKVALVHELLTVKGGAEKVARVFAEMFPDAPIHTLLYDYRKMGDWFPSERVITPDYGFPHKMTPGFYAHNHHFHLNKFSKAVESWDFSGYDLVLSSSSAFAHGIITNGAPKHLCYVHSPARYLWDRTHDVAAQAGKGLLGPVKKHLFQRTAHKLRVWDCEASFRPDALLAASAEVQRRIELYWRRDSTVLHPPIDDFWLRESASEATEREHPDYYLVVSTLARYKRVELAIEACNASGAHLKIVGEGPDKARLEKLAGPSIEFYGYRQGDELKDLYSGAKAVIFAGLEDFGLVPLEAMACGTPVIAYRGGGALETVSEGETGEFFDEPNADSLLDAMKKSEQKMYSKERLHAAAKPHSTMEFMTNLHRHIESFMND